MASEVNFSDRTKKPPPDPHWWRLEQAEVHLPGRHLILRRDFPVWVCFLCGDWSFESPQFHHPAYHNPCVTHP